MSISLEINTNGQQWDEKSLLAVFVELLYDFKLYTVNQIDWQEIRPLFDYYEKFLKDQHGIDITFSG